MTVVSVMVMVGALAGCGAGGSNPSGGNPGSGNPGSGNPSGSNSPGSTAAQASCAAANAAMINAALGTQVGDPKEQKVGHGVMCQYAPVGGGPGNVVLRIQTDVTRAAFDQARATSDNSGLPTTDLPGFEDAAYTSTISALSVTTNTVVALHGTIEILVSAQASFDAEKALEQQIFAELV
ncbi:MAG TPA: hypothetical protein VH561_03890 [Micromonosporaceae bacterium]